MDIFKKHIITKNQPADYGKVAGIVYNPSTYQLQGILVASSHIFSPFMVKWPLVRAIGDHYITIDSSYDIKPASEQLESYSVQSLTPRDYERPIVDSNLDRLGFISDVYLNLAHEQIYALEVTLDVDNQDKWSLPIQHVRSFHPQRITVANHAAAYIRNRITNEKPTEQEEDQTSETILAQFQNQIHQVWHNLVT